MKNILFTLLCLFISASEVQGQTWRWGNGTRGSNNYGRFCSKDTSGNIYVTGETFTGMQFLTDTIPNVSYTRVYLSKFDSSGNLLWVKANTGKNTTGRIATLGIATDVSGNTFVLGQFDSTISFDANTLPNPNLGLHIGPQYLSYLFLAKFDASGNNLWVKSIGNFPQPFWNIGNGLEVDCYGRVYLICNFYKNATIGSYSFINHDATGNTSDMLVAKLDSSGSVLWAKHMGGDSADYIVNLALTPTNDILITGSFFHYQLPVGSDILTDTSGIAGFASSFIAKLDNSGNSVWARKNGDGAYAAYITDITVNSSSEFFTLGYYQHDFILGTFSLPYASGSNSYIAKYDASCNLLWAKVMKGLYVYSEGVTLDGCGNAWVLGHFGSGLVTTNDTMDGNIIAPPFKNKEPLFISGWSSSGTYINTTVLPSGGRSSYKISTITDKANKLYIVGNNTLDTLNIAASTLYGTNSYTNMFLAKYDPGTSCAPLSHLSCENLSQRGLDVALSDVIIFPNPANSECIIRCNYQYGEGRCRMFDLQGRIIKTCLLRGYDTVIPVSELSPGMYIFRIEINGSIVTRKVTITN